MGLVGCVAIGFQVSRPWWESRDGRFFSLPETKPGSGYCPLKADDGWFQMSPFNFKGGGVKRPYFSGADLAVSFREWFFFFWVGWGGKKYPAPLGPFSKKNTVAEGH